MIRTPSVSFYQRVHQSTSAASVVVQSPTVTAFQTTQSAVSGQSCHLGQTSTSLIQSPTVSVTQTHTPCLSVNFPNRSKIYTISQTPMIQSPLISISQVSGPKTSTPLSVTSPSSTASYSPSISTSSACSLPLSASSVNHLLSTLVSQMLASPILQNSGASVATSVQSP